MSFKALTDRPLTSVRDLAVSRDDLGELLVKLPLYRAALFGGPEAGRTGAGFLDASYVLGTAV